MRHRILFLITVLWSLFILRLNRGEAQLDTEELQDQISPEVKLQILLDRSGFSPGEIDGRTRTKIAPGANNPVGLVWIGVSAPHYGLHGTPSHGKIGYSQSHGCVRMTNWDALRLASLIKPGTQVIFQ